MKILLVTNDLACTDGWSRYTADLIIALEKAGHEVQALVSSTVSDNKIKQYSVLERPLSYISGISVCRQGARKLTEIVETFSPDVIHFIVEPYVNMLAFASQFASKPRIIMTGHGTYAYPPNTENGLRRIIAKILFNKAAKRTDAVVCVSEFTKHHLISTSGTIFANKKVLVVTNGTSMRAVNIQKNNSIFTVLFVGAVKERKGVLESLRGIAAFKKEFQRPFVYRIVGAFDKDDEYVKTIESYIKTEGLENEVIFYGKVDDAALRANYEAADLYLMTPVTSGVAFEGFGLVYLEANAYGIPCIGSTNSGASEAIIDGKTGYKVDANDPSEIAAAMIKVANGAISADDCRTWTEQNSIENKAEEIGAIYSMKAS